MRTFYSLILSTNGSDIEKWRTLVNRHSQKDVFFTPEHAMVYERTGGATRKDFGGEALLFFLGNERDFIIYPFFKRKISELPFYSILGDESEDWFDIISPYGYSGPLAYIDDSELEVSLWQSFLNEFHNFCVENNIIAEFARLHPYFKNHLVLTKSTDINIEKKSSVVYLELEQNESQMWKNMTKGSKSSVSKARRSGIEIRCSSTEDAIESFYQLYIATMERNKAKKAYFFSRDFFNDTFQLLGENVRLFSAWYEDRVIAASLFLLGDNLVHYYLSGSDANYLTLSPNNLLLYEAILWAKSRGFKIMNLGGGYGQNDSLFHFKSSFSKTTADFYTYSRIHNQTVYERLHRARDLYGEQEHENVIQSDYFPIYRR
jgi:hypothetical protein